MFFGCLSHFGFQLILSVPTAFLLKGSKTGAVLGTFLTNHLTIFIIYPLQCYVGNRLTGGNLDYDGTRSIWKNVLAEQTNQALLELGRELVVSFFIGGALLTLVMTPVTYFLVKFLVIRFRRARSAREPETQKTVE